MNRTLTGICLAFLCIGLTNNNLFATIYYADPSSVSASSNGTLNNPWRTIAEVNAGTALLNPGDQVLFKRGQTYSGRLTVYRSGTAANPIVYGNYGSGNLPEFNNSISDVIGIYNKQYVIIDGISITDKSISATDRAVQAKISYAIVISNSSNCTIKNCNISLAGVGISVSAGSDNTTITRNYIHNLRMVRNTPTSINSNDDYGANPMVVGSSNNTISYNQFEECWALSYDYGYDGGAVELFGTAVNNNKIIYNTAINCDGFTEIGSASGGECNNNIVAYNKIINCGVAGTFQNSGTFYTRINNLQFYNNTIVETVLHYQKAANIFWMSGSGSAGMLLVKNNIFWLSTGVNIAQAKFSSGQLVHSNNIFRMTSGTTGFLPGNNEMVSNSAILFSSTSGDPSLWNYTPAAGSPAINFGTAVGFDIDFNGNPIIGNPDAGILELAKTDQVVVPLTASATGGKILCNGGTASINVSATGGIAPYTGTGIFLMPAGEYKYSISDAAGSNIVVSTTLVQPPVLSQDLMAGTILTAGGSTSLSAIIKGGSGPYSFSINNGPVQSNNVFFNLTAGNYAVKVTDANICSTIKSISISDPFTKVSGSLKNMLTVYPNPTSNYFSFFTGDITGTTTLDIEVYTILSTLVYKAKVSVGETVNFGHQFIAGPYILKAMIGKMVQTVQLIKL